MEQYPKFKVVSIRTVHGGYPKGGVVGIRTVHGVVPKVQSGQHSHSSNKTILIHAKKGALILDLAKKNKKVSYAKWGYIFLAPFFAAFAIFTLIPLISTFYYSFFEMYKDGMKQIGPNFIGFANFKKTFAVSAGSGLPDILRYFKNTLIMWIMGFVPQITLALLFASWFSSVRLRLKAQGFFKTVIYLPNLIMAAAFSMLFFALFSTRGPVNNLLVDAGILSEPYRFLEGVWSTRWLIALMNFLLWYGNTTMLLLAGILGIDASLYESAQIDGASSMKMFTKITLPILRPVMVYVLITSLIGGLQMFDVPQILTNGQGTPNRENMTVIMYLNRQLYSKNYGMGSAISVIVFIVTGILSFFVFKSVMAEGGRLKGGKK
jgi:multiple sugar transport system permease protein